MCFNCNKMRFLQVVFCVLITINLSAQTSFRKTSHEAKLVRTTSPALVEDDFEVGLFHLEAPLPNGDSYRSFLMQQKLKVDSINKLLSSTPQKTQKSGEAVDQPLKLRGFEPQRRTINGFSSFNVGIPSDNTLAISKDDILVVAVNSLMYAYDLKKDTSVITNQTITLTSLVGGSANESYYDPKLFYDPSVDRFIIVLLKDFMPETSEVIVCFSSTNNPNDDWFVYALPGDPLDTYRWTDFPAISVTKDKLYFTANLIIPNVSWQEGFDGSIIWEMDKNEGFNGSSDINAVLYDNIRYNEKFIRNLHPVQGADGVAEKQFFLSNRNFDLTNDTIFLAQFNEDELIVDAYRSNLPYGVPPNGRQQDTDTTDPTGGLQTNDARVLGAVLLNDEIQFVGNTRNPETGYAAIYHGVIASCYDNPSISGHIIGDEIKDFAYPNIAWAGNESCDNDMIIAFNHSSFDDFPGVSAVYVSNDGSYSTPLVLKEGGNFVNRLPSHYERWGDYFGLQRAYHEPGVVHSYGYLALENNRNSGYYSMLMSPDTTKLYLSTVITKNTGVCSYSITASPINGTAPFLYAWNNAEPIAENSLNNRCIGDTVFLSVLDSRGCTFEDTIVVKALGTPANETHAFPNPTSNLISIPFTLEEDVLIFADIYDNNGRHVKQLIELNAKKGRNEFTCSLHSLAAGNYTIVLKTATAVISTQKVIKY